MKQYISKNEKETMQIAAQLAKKVNLGTVCLLYGTLGICAMISSRSLMSTM